MQSRLVIEGQQKLQGQIRISGSKNAALPIMAATLLSDKDITIGNLPHLADIATMSHLLISLGTEIAFKGHGGIDDSRGKTMIFRSSNVTSHTAAYDIVSKMRASVLVLGPLLAKYNKAKVSLPGGCAIGARPVDLHLTALEKLGAKINVTAGYIEAVAESGLKGAEIIFPTISVGATENTIMAASLAEGTTIIKNAATEPEIIDLINFLNHLGAKISVDGRNITIKGVSSLNGGNYNISPDRIEAGSYAVATLATQGKVFFPNLDKEIFSPISDALQACGGTINVKEGGIEIAYTGQEKNEDYKIETDVYPGFPTDIQAQFATLLLHKKFNSYIHETIFENRFMHVQELIRMGANITVNGNSLALKPSKLSGTEVNASDLRASMALVIAGLTANGKTYIHKIHHLDRGYELLEEKLSRCGAKIYREYC